MSHSVSFLIKQSRIPRAILGEVSYSTPIIDFPYSKTFVMTMTISKFTPHAMATAPAKISNFYLVTTQSQRFM